MLNGNRRVVAAVLTASFALVLFGWSLLFAHEGEDHGAAPAATQAGGLNMPILVEKESQFLLGVLTEPASNRRLSRTVRVLGRVIPRTQGKAEIIPLRSGQVIADPKHPMPQLGEYVKEGQMVAVIEQALSAAERIEVRAEKLKVDAELEQVRKEYARLKAIEKVVAQKDLIEAEIRLRAAEKVQQLYAETISASMSASSGGRYYITSPISGVITHTDVTIGEQVEADKVLFKVMDLQMLWVEAQVYETDLARIEKSREAKISTQAYDDEYFNGRLFTLGSVVNEITRTVRVIFEVKNRDNKLRVGMFADVSIEIGNPEDVLVVPRSAVTTVRGKNVVFVHVEPEYFVGREVLLGDQNGEYVEIKSALDVGERVVTTGNYQLKSIVQMGG